VLKNTVVKEEGNYRKGYSKQRKCVLTKRYRWAVFKLFLINVKIRISAVLHLLVKPYEILLLKQILSKWNINIKRIWGKTCQKVRIQYLGIWAGRGWL